MKDTLAILMSQKSIYRLHINSTDHGFDNWWTIDDLFFGNIDPSSILEISSKIPQKTEIPIVVLLVAIILLGMKRPTSKI
ncbi:MAG: hypothetical protein ACFFB5_07605 [Promethearchaeota archaeon]